MFKVKRIRTLVLYGCLSMYHDACIIHSFIHIFTGIQE